jgi:hypothetical protein
MAVRRLVVVVFLVGSSLLLGSCSLIEWPFADTGMQQAVAVVTEQVLPDAAPAEGPFVCLRLQEALPPGSVIQEDAPAGQIGASGRYEPKSFTVGGESYFFYLDLAPGMFYEHPVKYIVVDKNGGHQIIDARWWPRINGEIPEPIRNPDPFPELVVAGDDRLSLAEGMLMEFDFDRLVQHREGFIVVQGLMEHENLYNCAVNTYLNGVAFFNAYKSAFSEVEGLVQSQAADVLDEIDEMVAGKMNPITIYIIAHGGYDGIRLGGEWITAQQFHGKMAEHPTTLFNFLLGSCHSGSFVDNLNVLDNVRVIVTACAADEGAAPDWDSAYGTNDHNPEDTGSEWTSSLLAAATTIVSSADLWAEVEELAENVNIPETSALLYIAGYGAEGSYSTLGLTQDLDLTHRVGATNPQHYRSWLLLLPIFPLIPVVPAG